MVQKLVYRAPGRPRVGPNVGLRAPGRPGVGPKVGLKVGLTVGPTTLKVLADNNTKESFWRTAVVKNPFGGQQ